MNLPDTLLGEEWYWAAWVVWVLFFARSLWRAPWRRLADADAAVIMKLGRNFHKVREVLAELGLADRALYVERATMSNQKIVPLNDVDPMSSPYFSLIIVPGERWQG